MTTTDPKIIAQRIIETAAEATPGPWIHGRDHVASLDPDAVARQRERDRTFGETLGRGGTDRSPWTAADHDAYLQEAAAHYGGGALICESICLADRTFISACREAPAVAARMLELEKRNAELEAALAEATSNLRDLRISLERTAPSTDPDPRGDGQR